MNDNEYVVFLERLHPELNRAKRVGQGKQVQSVSLPSISDSEHVANTIRSKDAWSASRSPRLSHLRQQ